MFFGQLPDQESDEAHHRHHGECDHHAGVEPVVLFAQVEHDLHRTHPDHQQRQADSVDRQFADLALTLAVQHPRSTRSGQADRHVDVEDPRPRDVVGDPAAQQRPHHGCHQSGHRPHRHRQTRQRTWVTRQQQRLRQRNHGPGHKTLQRTERDECGHVGGQATQP